ncbi:Oncostatin-M-specific receptor subunit beta [Triplophysa tibetana]|uniref:Oncostatin-M-specific receptor subunit beta n=1 Tax=Triplophysa tibetana TaxID=1572043 RepID=A0A5A9PDL3_9TELE|nr:Oncostatin-M-specific receptor subunit beta [Triplophysa tibetana]
METLEIPSSHYSSVMPVWVVCVLLSSLIHQTEQNGYLPPVKYVKVYPEENDMGAWVLNVEFVENTESENRMYDIEVLRTEQMMRVHKETIYVKAHPTIHHHWKWTSPLPLQCTSHSVRLRRRDQHQTSNWSALYTYKGQDLNASSPDFYPQNEYFLVGSNVTFCCILKAENVPSFRSSTFTIRISNRTFITEPFQFDSTSKNKNLFCDDHEGTTFFIGYTPDDQNLTCVTRDLSSVQCSWNSGRETRLEGLRGETKYTLNGRRCQFNPCVQPENNETSWTLTAQNPLGVMIINDTADPLHRVWLNGPKNMLSNVNERNATLQWSWDEQKYNSFSIICQVELNRNIYNKTFSGTGLKSFVLEDLQPVTDYSAKVHCGSSEHFYIWSEWSKMTDFRTKEDIPEPVDVWMQYLEESTYVIWKKHLTKDQSNGVLTGYKVTITDTENKTSIYHAGPNSTYYSVSSVNETGNQMISVSAKNSAGLSPPASIIITRYPASRVEISRINGSNGGFDIVWLESSSSTCGYVVDWVPTYSHEKSAVQWKRIPAGHLNKRIESEFLKQGVRYNVSVYSCTSGAPQLLQRGEGYAIEKKPFEIVGNIKVKSNGRNLVLSWEKLPLDKHGGFMLGYKVNIFHYASNKTEEQYETKNTTVHLKLSPGSYAINISAFTSAGEGDNATFHGRIEKDILEMILATVVGSSLAAFAFIIITFMCFKWRKWLKKMLYPDIPKPKLSGQWTKKGIYCSEMTKKDLKCEIHEVHSVERTALDVEDGTFLIRSTSILLPANDLYQKCSEFPDVSSFSPGTSFITLDPISSQPFIQNLISAIENPSYNLISQESINISLLSEPALEMDDSYHPTPNNVHNTFQNKDS